MSLLTLEAKLERVDPSTQWGFRMQGGQDFSAPLAIQRVLPGSLAAKCGLQQGDIILKIGNSDANIMKHKDAQGAIMGSGNKLDLLLQRIREKKAKKPTNNYIGKNLEQYMEDESTTADQGAPPHQYQYEKFSAPAIPSKAGGLIQYDSTSSNYNVSARPYGAPTPPTQSSTFQSQLNTIAQQTQNIDLTPKPAVADFQTAAQRYTEREDKPPSASQQSKSFKTLQEAIDSGQGPPSAILPIQTTNTPVDRRSPSPIQPGVSNIGTPKLNTSHVAQFNNISQFNSPAGLYNSDSANSSYRVQRTNGSPPDTSSGGEKEVDDFGRKIYRPSETFKLVHEQDDPTPKKDENFKSNPSRTFQILQQQLEPGTAAPPPPAPPAVDSHSVPSWVPGVSKRPDLPVEIAAERLSDVLQDAPQDLPQIQPLVSNVPPDVAPPQPAPPQEAPTELPISPKPAPAPAPAQAPAPVPWASTAPKAAAAAPKAFVPKVQSKASAPGGPRPGDALPRPTGTGAVRGKKGDVTVYQEGQPLPGGARVPICSTCGNTIRGPFVVAMHKTWCPDHFVCAQPRCGVKLLDIGFVEEGGFLYCEKDYETYFAPKCSVCSQAIVGECVNALQKTYHPDCFTCHQCKQAIGGNQFHLEDGHAYCEHDWKQMFQTMCKGCAFPIEPGDRWVEAMGSNYHSECFNCSTCQVSLEGQPFYAKAGKPYCKKHAR
ncbi:PDZ and LIM domain protein 7-like isoform X2 [Mizuhopecten yessoensis]|uniref:PDZ and LIM domain protein 7-like isoform X2 n=1 Tax=Mizuhopecten yessoensis TaxID=6573 RepID=UPI000B45ADB4|nr:PDZ and LIM domain protein 7-like isoform X2 [Mizuhopecten yessoensis]